MLKRSVLLLLVVVLLTGCVGAGKVNKKTINLTWRTIPTDISVMTLNDKEMIAMGNRYAYTPTAMDAVWVEVEADLNGRKSVDFNFQLNSVNPYEQTGNNKLIIQPERAEKGSILVEAEGHEELFEYIVFPANIIKIWGSPNDEVAFSFEQGKHVKYGEGDIQFTTQPDPLYHLKANVVILDAYDFWDEFVNVNNLHEYNYSEQVFKPDLSKLYLIKTKNKGYAAMRFTVRSDSSCSFIYKYSETGIFE